MSHRQAPAQLPAHTSVIRRVQCDIQCTMYIGDRLCSGYYGQEPIRTYGRDFWASMYNYMYNYTRELGGSQLPAHTSVIQKSHVLQAKFRYTVYNVLYVGIGELLHWILRSRTNQNLGAWLLGLHVHVLLQYCKAVIMFVFFFLPLAFQFLENNIPRCRQGHELSAIVRLASYGSLENKPYFCGALNVINLHDDDWWVCPCFVLVRTQLISVEINFLYFNTCLYKW